MVYKCLVAPWVHRLLAILLGAFSILIVWSEATIGIGSNSGKTDLSPFSHVSPSLLVQLVHCICCLPLCGQRKTAHKTPAC